MKRTIINLVIAVPLATAALTMTPGVALADDGPIIVLPPPGGDPEGPVIGIPEPGPTPPTGPGDITAPQPCPTHGGGAECVPDGGDKPGDQPGDKPGDKPGKPGKPQGGDKPTTQVESIALPTRIDAGVAPATDDSLELSWVLAGGALVTASGAAFAARRVRNRA